MMGGVTDFEIFKFCSKEGHMKILAIKTGLLRVAFEKGELNTKWCLCLLCVSFSFHLDQS